MPFISEVDDQAVSVTALPETLWPPPDRDLEARFARKGNRRGDIRCAVAPCYQQRPLVDQAVVNLAAPLHTARDSDR